MSVRPVNGRFRTYWVLIALLAAVNVGRWVFAGAAVKPAPREQALLAEDFRLKVDVPGANGQGRNLFTEAGSSSSSGAFGRGPAAKRGVGARPAVNIAPASAPDAVQAMAASELGKMRLLGVVFHGGKRQAYLAQDRENAIAGAGDTVFGQYAVDAVSVDAVELRDVKTNMTRRIPVSGK